MDQASINPSKFIESTEYLNTPQKPCVVFFLLGFTLIFGTIYGMLINGIILGDGIAKLNGKNMWVSVNFVKLLWASPASIW